MKILVLGSQGFIGSHLVDFFLNKALFVTGCDLIEYSSNRFQYHRLSINSIDFETLLEGQTFDFCVNAAGSGNVPYSFKYPSSDFEANTISVSTILETLKKTQANCKYLHISSAAVYGNPIHLPIKETAACSPISPYGYHKWMSEILCKEYYRLYKQQLAIIRPFSVYGNGLKKQLLWDLCQKIEKEDSVSLYGTGNETRDFIHIYDLCELIFKVMYFSPFRLDIYNAAGGEEVSIKQIVEIFEKKYKFNKTITFSGETKKGDPLNWKSDIQKIQKLAYQPKIKLEDGISNYIDWFKNLINE